MDVPSADGPGFAGMTDGWSFADGFELAFECGGREGSCRRLRAISRPPRGIPCERRFACSRPLRKAKGRNLLYLIDGFSGLVDLVSEVGVLDGGVVD